MKIKLKTHELDEIFLYAEGVMRGSVQKEPKLKKKRCKKMFVFIKELLELNASNNEQILLLLHDITSLSEFDVNMHFIANQLKNISAELSLSSTSNMAVTEEATASFNEVTTNLENGADIVEKIAARTKMLVQINEMNNQQINEATELKQRVMENSLLMKEKISVLEQISKKVEKIMTGVKAITEQTNLLALNASIEAARAGENGKGFSVVAEEVRQLAESTKLKLEDMQGFTEAIRQASREGIKSVDSTMDSIENMGSKLEAIRKNFGESVSGLNAEADNIQQLAGMMQQISSSAQEIASTVTVTAEESQRISSMAQMAAAESEKAALYSDKIGSIDVDLSSRIKELVDLLNKGTHPISYSKFVETLEKAIASHEKWVEKLNDILTDGTLQPIQTDASKCEFGHFYTTMTIQEEKIKPLWDEVGELHTHLHHKGEEILSAIHEGRLDETEIMMQTAKETSSQIIEKIKNIIKTVKKMEKDNEKIFKGIEWN